MRIFLSHSHKDNDWCTQFAAELSKQGADVWYDKAGLYVGAQWVKEIQAELEGRDVFLVVVTPDAFASEWVQEEISLALTLHKRLISVIHKPTRVTGFLQNRQMLDATEKSPAVAAAVVSEALGLKEKDEYCSVQIRRDGFRTFVELSGPYADSDGGWESRIVSISRLAWPTTTSDGRKRWEVELAAAVKLEHELEEQGWKEWATLQDEPFDGSNADSNEICSTGDFKRKHARRK